MSAWKEPVDVATTEPLGAAPAFPAFSGVIDGITLQLGDRVLVKDQLMSTENGYYQVGAEIPPTLIATADTIEAEDVISVKQGDSNAHTFWSLIDATNRIFVRQSLNHYSLKSIDALKHLWQVLPDAIATIATYAEPGDKGGGDFTFLGLRANNQVLSALAVSEPISTVMDVDDGLVTITAVAHGLGGPNNVTSTYISGLTGLADKAYSVRVVTPDTFTIINRFSGVAFAAGAKIQYVRLVTADPHERATGQRISVSGVAPLEGAADIRGVNDLSGVINETTLSIPIATTGGKYLPGDHAVIGDDGITVPATDLTGTFGGVWQRLQTNHFDVRWFGAKGDWNSVTKTGTDDLPAFIATLGAMKAGGNKTNKLVADGHFFLSDTLVLTQTILLEGSGQNEPPPFLVSSRSMPGTMFAFPKNVTGIRIRGGAGLDNPTKTFGNLFPPSGEKTILRNMTIYCKDADAKAEAVNCRDQEDDCFPEGNCFHGIHSSAPVRLENVTVEFFAHDGIHIAAAVCGKTVLDEQGNTMRVYDGNADGSYLENCSAGDCGRDGFHFSGGDAQACLISRCSGVVNGRAGFFDDTFGNTYLGCHSEGNIGESYITKGDVNASVFLNCWSESAKPSIFRGAVTIISGKIGGDPEYMTKDSSAFILEHGVASRAPLVYLNREGLKPIRCSFGDGGETIQGPGSLMIALNWATLDAGGNPEDNTWLRYLDGPGIRGRLWWALMNNDPSHRHVIRFPTMQTNVRQAAPWFVNGIFLGRDDFGALEDPPKVSFTAAPTLPVQRYNGGPLTYERGDVVWQSEPLVGEPLGQVCVVSGTQGTLNNETATGSILSGTTELTVSPSTSLEIGQYIKIAGVSDRKQIVSIEGLVVTIDKAADATVEDALVSFSHAVFATFGTVDSPSRSYDADHPLDRADRYITVTATSTQTLPGSPVDGQTHHIKSGTGVTTKVDTEGGVLTIDNKAFVTLAPGNSGTFRYSTATSEWELR
jgi:hypothetical protein